MVAVGRSPLLGGTKKRTKQLPCTQIQDHYFRIMGYERELKGSVQFTMFLYPIRSYKLPTNWGTDRAKPVPHVRDVLSRSLLMLAGVSALPV